MRTKFILIVTLCVSTLQAQHPVQGNFPKNNSRNTFSPVNNVYDSGTPKKWSLNRYTGLTTGYSFSRRGGFGFIAAPATLQFNHRLNDNVYAFAGVSLAPMYINFNSALISTGAGGLKNDARIYQPGSFSMYSAATLGVMYINNDKTFSVSGSINIERSRYPPLGYNNFLNTTSRPPNIVYY